MNSRIVKACASALVLLTIFGATAKADCEVIVIEAMPTPTPPPAMECPLEEETRHYEHDETEVKILARLLWSSPLRAERYKRDLLWVVFNRVRDTSDLFGDEIKSVVTTSEFAFYDKKAHVSKENVRIVREELDRFYSLLDGLYIGKHPNGLYIRFEGEDNRILTVLDER